MSKRLKIQIGDVFGVPLGDSMFGIGRILKRRKATLFVELFKTRPVRDLSSCNLSKVISEETLFKTWCYDEGFRQGEWKVIGNIPLVGPVIMPDYWTESSDGQYYLIPGSDDYLGKTDQMRQVQKDEIADAVPLGIAFPGYVEKSFIKKLKEANLYSIQ